MKGLIALTFIFCSFSSWALSGRESWKISTIEQQAKILDSYRTFFHELSKQESKTYGEWYLKKTSLWSLMINEAWADTNMDCIYAGWPSRRVKGLCSSPARQNPDYQNGTCSSNEMQCQPMFFGKGLCVPTGTRSQRNLAFSNCNKKFKASKKTNEDVINEIKSDGKKAEFLELLDFADGVCSNGKQASTGMCTRLKETVSKLREHEVSVPVIPEETVAQKPTEDELRGVVEVVTESLDQVETMDQSDVDCPPEIENPESIQEVAQVIEEASRVPAAEQTIAISETTYTPQEALADINSSQLTFLGRHKFPNSDSNYTCVFKSNTAYVLYNNCMSKRHEAQATDIDVISFDGGMITFYVENGSSNPGRISQMDRSQYDSSWKFYYLPSSPIRNVGIEQLKDYRGDLITYKDGACWIGTQGKAQDMTSNKVQCTEKASSRRQDWEPHAESFWRNPGPGWYQAQRTLRRLVETVPF